MLQTKSKWHLKSSDSRQNNRYHACGHGNDHGHGGDDHGHGAHAHGHGCGHDLLLHLHH